MHSYSLPGNGTTFPWNRKKKLGIELMSCMDKLKFCLPRLAHQNLPLCMETRNEHGTYTEWAICNKLNGMMADIFSSNAE